MYWRICDIKSILFVSFFFLVENGIAKGGKGKLLNKGLGVFKGRDGLFLKVVMKVWWERGWWCSKYFGKMRRGMDPKQMT